LYSGGCQRLGDGKIGNMSVKGFKISVGGNFESLRKVREFKKSSAHYDDYSK
jgi:hypothetical protein